MKTYLIYLGILIGANHRKASTWELIVQKFESNLSRWKQRSLSIGGRVTLINSILSSLPLFFLLFFKIPTCVVNELVHLQCEFLWRGEEGRRKIAWGNEDGGYIVVIIAFGNKCYVLNIAKGRARKRHMTNGPTKIYVGGWVMEGKSNFGSNHGWKNYKLEDSFMNELEGASLVADGQDSLVWKLALSGCYSVKDTYLFLIGNTNPVDPLFNRSFWKLVIPHNVAIFVWKLSKDRLPIRKNLQCRNILLEEQHQLCPFCSGEEEDNNHLIFTCPFSYQIWQNCYKWIGVQITQHRNPKRTFLYAYNCFWFKRNKTIVWRVVWCAVAWSIWCHRNKIVFEGE
ncbi:putative ribonuclease H protein [Glycine max]|nr:putative ribonuclease H protein [Glycine max]